MASEKKMKATEQELTDLANMLCKKYGYKEHAKVVYNPRLYRRIGWCTYSTHVIELSTRWVIANNKWFVIRILKHEIIHFHIHTHCKSFDVECKRLGIKGGAYVDDGINPRKR
jgi:predicted SprT family Zn-dependent metalloprotease